MATGYVSPGGGSAVTSVEGRIGAVDVTASDVGLDQVNNTADAAKPISTATATALAGKASTGHTHAGTYEPADADLTAIAALSPANDDVLQRKAGAWTNRTVAQLLADLGLGSWVALSSFGTNMAVDASGTYYVAGQRTEPGSVARLRGRINTTVSYVANATICILDAAYRPTKDIVKDYRSGGSGAVAGFLTITSAGAVSFSANITVAGTAWFSLDAITYSLIV